MRESIIRESKKIFAKHKDIILVTLFGSYARGEQKPGSDIDLLVWVSPKAKLKRNDIWDYWDKHSTHLNWSDKVSVVVRKAHPIIQIETILMDYPEEHIAVYDPKGLFQIIKKTILKWRKKNNAKRLVSSFGKPYWRYTDKDIPLHEINFDLELKNVA